MIELKPELFGFIEININTYINNDDDYILYQGIYSETGEICWTLTDSLYSKIIIRCSEDDMIFKLTEIFRKKKIFLILREIENESSKKI